MAIVNPLLNVKDSRWLQLEVCREFQRNKCTRPDSECKFAHPAANVEVQNGRVIACYDSIKGRCNREKPPCKYFHPPKHLKDQLIINGKNHLALKNALMQQVPFQTVLAGQLPMVGSVANLLNTYPRNLSPSTMVNPQPYSMAAFASALNGQSPFVVSNPNLSAAKAPNPYLTNLPALAAASTAAAYGAYAAQTPAAMQAMQLMTAEQLSSSYGLTSTSSTASSAVSSPGASGKSRAESVSANPVTGNAIESHVITAEAASSINAAVASAAAAAAAGRKRTRESNDELLMQISGAYPMTKRAALDKNGTPLYPGAPTAAYPQPLAVHQPFVPLSFYFPLVGQSNTLPRY